MLGEFVDGDQPCVVVGIGINVRPIPGQSGATSIVECGGADDPNALLAALLREFSARRRNGSGVVDELRKHSATLGSRVRAELPGGAELHGDAVDLTADGELVVRGRRRARPGIVVASGDVVHLRAGLTALGTSSHGSASLRPMSSSGTVVVRRTWPQRLVILCSVGVIAAAIGAWWLLNDVYESFSELGRVEFAPGRRAADRHRHRVSRSTSC